MQCDPLRVFGKLRFLSVSTVAGILILTGPVVTAAVPSQGGQTANGLSIKLEGSRQHLAVGTSFGISGTVTNNTKSIVYVNERFLTLKVPVEVEGPGTTAASVWFAHMPAANHGETGNDFLFKATVALKPGQTSSAFWFVNQKELRDSSQRSTDSASVWNAVRFLYEQLSTELNFLFFEPGNYRLTVTANYWDNIGLTGNPNLAVESSTVDVAAPQSVILLGASIGGLIAYMILPQTRRQRATRSTAYRAAAAVTGALGAMLLSAIVTILLARISESQFLIRVTVSDLWGAIAIGFVANYFGVGALNKIVGASNGQSGQQQRRKNQTNDQEDMPRKSGEPAGSLDQSGAQEKQASQSFDQKG
jgi:hypothetical protein